MAWRGVVEEFRDVLPPIAPEHIVTLGEGNTPLLRADSLSERTGCDVYIKVEGANPTGSFKDRGMTVALSRARQAGSRAVLCASTGNTSASAAAYAARAGLSCIVLLPAGKVATGKLAQALVHGARLVQLDGGFDDCLRVARELAETYPVALVNSVNPDRIEGQRTAAFEIVRALGCAPDVHVLPVGNAGNITAYWKGYSEAVAHGWASSAPVMRGFQATGAAPFVIGGPVSTPETVATAIRIGNPASWDSAQAAVEESKGSIEAVSDAEILAAQQLLASTEGIFVEPASAASIAGLLLAAGSRDGSLERSSSSPLVPGSLVVCTVTGHGLKDPQAVNSMAPTDSRAIKGPSVKDVASDSPAVCTSGESEATAPLPADAARVAGALGLGALQFIDR